MLLIADAAYWAASFAELSEAIALASSPDGATDSPGGGSHGMGAAPVGQERLTLTVEEAAVALGISRAFAYDAVRRGDIPAIKIGRRILVPRTALSRLLGETPEGDSEA